MVVRRRLQIADSLAISFALSSNEKTSRSSVMYSGTWAAVTAVMFCWMSQRKATCAAETECALPIAMTSGIFITLPPARPSSGESAHVRDVRMLAHTLEPTGQGHNPVHAYVSLVERLVDAHAE